MVDFSQGAPTDERGVKVVLHTPCLPLPNALDFCLADPLLTTGAARSTGAIILRSVGSACLSCGALLTYCRRGVAALCSRRPPAATTGTSFFRTGEWLAPAFTSRALMAESDATSSGVSS